MCAFVVNCELINRTQQPFNWEIYSKCIISVTSKMSYIKGVFC